METKRLTRVLIITLMVVVILIVISAYYSPEVPEIKEEKPKMVIAEESVGEKKEPEPVIEEVEIIEPKEVTIKVNRGFFDPAEITIEKGTKVIWLNDDDNAHKIASTTRYFYGDRFLPGEKYSFTFNEAGEYNYFDVIFYKTMKGKIIVREEVTLITGKVISVPNYKDKTIGALILVTIIAMLSIHLMFYYERKHKK